MFHSLRPRATELRWRRASVCTVGSGDFYVSNDHSGCQYDLHADGNAYQNTVGDATCVNAQRHTNIAQSDGWTRWAMSQQRIIGKDAQLNWITSMGTHNSYSNAAQGYNSPLGQNQVISISDQLDSGARVLEIDPHAYLFDATGHLTVCHGSPIEGSSETLGCAVTSGDHARYLSAVFQEIRNWLNANPTEIITLFIDAGGPSDNTLDNHQTDFAQDVQNGFGNLIWTYNNTQSNGNHFPSISQMQSAGKQVLLISNYQEGTATLHPMAFDTNNGFAQFPTNSDDSASDSIKYNTLQSFGNCVDTSNKSWLPRAQDSWFRMSEGRSGSDFLNSITANPNNPKFSNLLDEPGVIGGNLCAASYIELDYLFARDQPSTARFQGASPDTRYKASVWSWAQGEDGHAGPAALSMANDVKHGYWVSVPTETAAGAPQRFYAACVNQTAPFWGNPVWALTKVPVPFFNQPSGEVGAAKACANLGSSYTFAPPFNAHESATVYKLASDDHIADYVWLNYRVGGNSPEFSSFPVIYRFTYGGTPVPQTVKISGLPNKQVQFAYIEATLHTKVNVSPAQVTLDANGVAQVTLTLDISSATIPIGQVVEFGLLQVAYTDSSAIHGYTVLGTWIVVPTAVTIVPASLTPSDGGLVGFNTHLNPSLTPYSGTLSLLEQITRPAANGLPAIQYLSTLSTSVIQGETLPVRNFQVTLGAGPHQILAAFIPNQSANAIPIPVFPFAEIVPTDSYHAEGASQTVTVTATQHLEFTPKQVSFSFPFGGAIPASQTIALLGTDSLTLKPDQPWYGASFDSGTTRTPHPTIAISLQSAAVAKLAPGTYTGQLGVLDLQGATNAAKVVDYIPVTLTITTQLSASPSSLSLAVGKININSGFNVVAASNGAVPLTVRTNVPWLRATLVAGISPSLVSLSVDASAFVPGNVLAANVTVQSPDAPDLVVPVKVYGVVSTAFVSNIEDGNTIMVDGSSIAIPATIPFIPGTSHTIAAPQYIQDSYHTDGRAAYSSWSDGGAIQHKITGATALTGPKFTVTYVDQYPIATTVSPAGSGTVTISPASSDGYYTSGAALVLTATPAKNYQFVQYTGPGIPTTTTTALSLTVGRSQNLLASFAAATPTITATVTCNQPGVKITVGTTEYTLPASITMAPGTSYKLAAESPYSPAPGVQWVYQSWSNSGAQTQTLKAPTQNFNLSLTYSQQFQLTTAANPVAGGTVSGAGWYNAGATAMVQSITNTGYTFAAFSGAANASVSPVSMAVNGPVTVTANYVTGSGPALSAITNGQRTDGPDTGQRTVPLAIVNNSASGVGHLLVEIASVTVVSGTGKVSVVTPPPTLAGDLAPNSNTAVSVVFNWPATATRVSFLVKYTGNNGGYSGSNLLTISR